MKNFETSSLTYKPNGLTVSDLRTSTRELIARLQKATGPDRELRDDVLLACGWTIEEHGDGGPDTYLVWVSPDETDDFREGDQPDPTASIDAALTLLPLEPKNEPSGTWDWQIESTNGGLTISARVGSDTLSFADTPAIALCIAALKARLADVGDRNAPSTTETVA